MNEVSGHRGPDYSDIYTDDDVVLGHNRLSIDLDSKANNHLFPMIMTLF